jgi:Secretion system C-terminal sorting domain
MKFFTRSLLLAGALAGLSSAAMAQTLYDNFENTRLVTYPYVDGTFTQNAANPAVGTNNPSSTVGQFARNAGVQYNVIVINPTTAPKFGDVADYLAGTRSVTLKAYSPAVGTQFQLVMQDKDKTGTGYPNGNIGGAFNATTSVANAWETLTFAFSAGPSDPTVLTTDIDQMVLLIAPGTADGSTYYLDDLKGPDFVAAPPPRAPMLYDNYENVHELDYRYNLSSGVMVPDTLNPFSTAANNSTGVARYTRSNVQYDVLVARPKSAVIDAGSFLSGGVNHMTMKVYSPGPGHLFQITLQDSSRSNGSNYPAGRHSEHQATTTLTNAWETLTFNNTGRPDPTISNTSVNEFVLLIDPNTFVPQRYYLDDWYGPALANPTGLKADKGIATGLTAWPNPATNQATVSFSLRTPATVSVQLFDLQGRLVASPLAAQTKAAGEQSVRFSTANLANGLYQYRVLVNGGMVSGKLSIVR